MLLIFILSIASVTIMTNLFFSRSYHNRRRFAASKEQKTIQASKKVGVQFKTAGRLQVDPVFNPSKHDQ